MPSPTNEKPVKDWEWDDLRRYCAWCVVQGLLRGDDLMAIMHNVCHITLQWQREVDAKKNKKG
jgi:hypothetical protein